MWVMLMADAPEGLNLFKILFHAHPVSKFVFAVLVICSIWSIAVIVERWLVFRRAQRAVERAGVQLAEWAAARQWDEARGVIAQSTRETEPLFSMLRAGIAYWDELVAAGEHRLELMQEMVAGAVGRELKLVKALLRANLSVLANIASVAPFIGLFGTVVGIVLTFDTIAKTGNLGQQLVASGIADALIATAMGLFAAIPAVVAYNYFTDRINQLLLQMEQQALERIYFFVQRDAVSESVLVKE